MLESDRPGWLEVKEGIMADFGGRPASEDGCFVHRINDAGEIVYVNEAWLRDAREGGAPELKLEAVLGQCLWNTIADQETRELYIALVQRVRQTGQPVRIPYRCDSPTERRSLLMTILLADEGLIEFSSRLVRAEPRPSVALLEPDAERGDDTVSICGWCNKVDVPGTGYVELEEAIGHLGLFEEMPLPRITQVACPECGAAVRRIIYGTPD
jgi:hypothetical protein